MEQRSSFLLAIMLIWLQASDLSGANRPPSEVHLEKKQETPAVPRLTEYPPGNERLESLETNGVSDCRSAIV